MTRVFARVSAHVYTYTYMHTHVRRADNGYVLNQNRTSLIFLSVVDCHVTSICIGIIQDVPDSPLPLLIDRIFGQFRSRSLLIK